MVRYVLIGGFVFTKMTVPLIMELRHAMQNGRGARMSPGVVKAMSKWKKGDEEIPGLTDSLIPRRLGPKRASKIRKLFALSKDDDVRKYVIRRELPAKAEGKKGSSKAPKIQRLVTPQQLQRKRDMMRFKKTRQAKAKTEAADYQKLLAQRQKEVRDKKMEP